MIKFKQFILIEQTKAKLKQMIKQAIQQIRKQSKIIVESAQNVQKLINADLNQTKQDTNSLNKFLQEFNNLTQQQQLDLIHSIAKLDINTNNNQIKLILIYQKNKDSLVGQEAYNTVITNKTKMFQRIATKKVQTNQLTEDQLADYVQQMFATLCGSGQYGEKYSLDAYDPYSGVPFNTFIYNFVAPAAFNKFIAINHTSVANDYTKQRDDINVSSDTSEAQKIEANDDVFSSIDTKTKLQLVNKVLNDQVPQRYQLRNIEKIVIKLLYFDNLKKNEVADKLGYKHISKTMVDNMVQKLKKAIEYLQKN